MPRNSPVRAITTRYKGYAFRSRLEARWAVFFDHLGIRWDYEPEGYELGNGLRYLPDFWLPDAGFWVEVKPGPPDDAAREKAWRLVLHSGHPLFMTHGMPDGFGRLFVTTISDYGTLTPDGDKGLEYEAVVGWHMKGSTILVMDDEAYADSYRNQLMYKQAFVIPQILCVPGASRRAPVSKNAVDALQAARSARFEFGARGAQ